MRKIFFLKYPLPLLLLLSLFLYSNFSSAEIYKWVDDKGDVHFTDRPPKNKKTEKVTVIINTYTNVSVSDNIFAASKNTSRQKKLIMYSTTWCGVCKRAKKYFQKNSIAFTEYDVEKSSKGKRDYKKMNGKGVPIFLIGKKRLNGFDTTKFNQIYGATSQ
jgi:glutaredoxin